MSTDFDRYSAAHERFRENNGLRPMAEEDWAAAHAYLLVARALDAKLVELLPPKEADERLLTLWKAAFVSRNGPAYFNRTFPTVVPLLAEQREAFIGAYRGVMQPVCDLFNATVADFPLCRASVDVLVEQGLSLTVTNLRRLLGACDYNTYEVLLKKRAGPKGKPAIIHELVHLFFRESTVVPDSVQKLHEIGDPSPLEEAVDKEAEAALRRDTELASYVYVRVKRVGNFRGFVPRASLPDYWSDILRRDALTAA